MWQHCQASAFSRRFLFFLRLRPLRAAFGFSYSSSFSQVQVAPSAEKSAHTTIAPLQLSFLRTVRNVWVLYSSSLGFTQVTLSRRKLKCSPAGNDLLAYSGIHFTPLNRIYRPSVRRRFLICVLSNHPERWETFLRGLELEAPKELMGHNHLVLWLLSYLIDHRSNISVREWKYRKNSNFVRFLVVTLKSW